MSVGAERGRERGGWSVTQGSFLASHSTRGVCGWAFDGLGTAMYIVRMPAAARCFERHDAGVPDRVGVNPFTKEPMTLKGRPSGSVRCEVEVVGNEVVTCWSWHQREACVEGPHRQKEGFADGAEAETYAADLADDLCTDGFRERTALPVAVETLGDARTAVTSARDPRPLVEATLALCGRRKWFGGDTAFRFAARDAMDRKRFAYPPATAAQIEETERRLGFALPPLLRALYSGVANGGFGPGYGLVGAVGGSPDEWVENIADGYRIDREPGLRIEESGVERGHVDWFEPFYDQWPGRVVRLVHWGCAIWSCLDMRHGRVFRYEALGGKSTRAAMEVEAESLEGWWERWVRGEAMFEVGRGVEIPWGVTK